MSCALVGCPQEQRHARPAGPSRGAWDVQMDAAHVCPRAEGQLQALAEQSRTEVQTLAGMRGAGRQRSTLSTGKVTQELTCSATSVIFEETAFTPRSAVEKIGPSPGACTVEPCTNEAVRDSWQAQPTAGWEWPEGSAWATRGAVKPDGPHAQYPCLLLPLLLVIECHVVVAAAELLARAPRGSRGTQQVAAALPGRCHRTAWTGGGKWTALRAPPTLIEGPERSKPCVSCSAHRQLGCWRVAALPGAAGWLEQALRDPWRMRRRPSRSFLNLPTVGLPSKEGAHSMIRSASQDHTAT